jgi:hypothetical protein
VDNFQKLFLNFNEVRRTGFVTTNQ